jgi:two-component system, NtrC family, sensor kinase
MAETPNDAATDSQRAVAELQRKLDERTAERDEAFAQQAATTEVLQIINASPGDLAPVFDAIVTKAMRLCGAPFGGLWTVDGDLARAAAFINIPAPFRDFLLQRPTALVDVFNRGLQDRPVHVSDMLASRAYRSRVPVTVASVELGGIRTFLGVPLLKDGSVVGVIGLYRLEVRPFSERQIALVQSFAAQAVIAIENTRLFNETQEATRDLEESLQQQTAAAEVLKVISRSAFDLNAVLATLVESARDLCDAPMGVIFLRDGDAYRISKQLGYPPEFEQYLLNNPVWANRGSGAGRAALTGQVAHIPDVLADPEYSLTDLQHHGGYRAVLSVPLLREGEVIGVFSLSRTESVPFTQRQIELVHTFADQAVIAIENVRLFDEVQARTADLSESLQQQTATADVLKVISRSLVDLETVLETLVETVARLCRADQVYMFHLRHDLWHLVAAWGLSAEAREYFLTNPFTPGRGSTSGRAALERRAVLIPDVLQDPEYALSEGQKIAGYRSTLGIPLLREDTLIGVFSITRTRVEAFTEKEIELATTFADQAVIAIENARLFEELHDRQAELRVTFDNMGDGVAMFGADKQLAAWNRNLQEMLDLPDALLFGRPSFAELFHYLAARGEFGSADLEAELSRSVEDTRRQMRYERTRPDGRIVEVRRNPVPDGGFVLIYADITERKRAEEAIRLARDAAEKALQELQTAQDRLVQTEKLASLGQLTAGIAHEIKNPLNFVNNFSALSVELTDELKEVLAQERLTDKGRAETNELTGLLKDNLSKVVQHGKRADSIVKNMLLHSREGSGERRSAEINRLVEESLNLAYHGARAETPGFAITLKHALDPEAGALDLYPQEITRALLNLISNGFYAALGRKAESDNAFEPVLSAATRNLGEAVEIRIRDNGSGIPPDVRERIFTPFFTTKPTGEGTGLGLSMTHDIIVKQHGGRIDVETELGVFTEFIITLPREKGASS